MEQKELAELTHLTDEELLAEGRKIKSGAITNAILIGFLVGVVVYSVAVNSFGFLTLIPLFIAYKLLKNSKRDKAIEELLKERNLKK